MSGDRAYNEVIKVSEVITVGPKSHETAVLIRRGTDTREISLFLCICTKKRPYEDTGRRTTIYKRGGVTSSETNLDCALILEF